MGKTDLIKIVEKLINNREVSQKVRNRINEFQIMNSKDSKYWFEELCFCILTANSSAKKGIEIQNYLSRIDGFRQLDLDEIEKVLEKLGHRYPKTRAKFIFEARKYQNIKEIINSFENEFIAREWLVKNVKGIGYKEASHFLRNVGYHNLAILDRHILRILKENQLINEIPETLTGKKYKEIEKIIIELSKEMKVLPSEMDLYLWYTKTGEVLK
ncbi:MAG: N-glycosylase/DNA lyase [Candidatus Aenigmatarchaeota archaeon]